MAAFRMLARTALRTPMTTRTFSMATVARADIVADMYLKSLKEFKPTPAKASDADGQVKPWSIPKAPAAPEVKSDVSSELSAYESSDSESASASGSQSSSSDNDGDWFELDTTPDHAHH